MHRLVIATLVSISATASAGGLTIGGEAALGYDGNVANARQGAHAREAGFAEADASLERTWDVADDSALQARFGIDTQAFTEYQRLDNAKGSLQLRYLLRPTQAFYAPLFALTGNVAWWEFNSGIRDGADYRASAFLREQVTTRIAVRVTGTLDWRRSHSEVFDLRTRWVGIDVDWALTNRIAAYAGFQRRWGQFVSTRPESSSYGSVTTYADDDAFPGEEALRLDGAANISTGGVNFALTPRVSLDLQGTFVESGASTGIHYRRVQSVASLLARF